MDADRGQVNVVHPKGIHDARRTTEQSLVHGATVSHEPRLDVILGGNLLFRCPSLSPL